ncbi:hypothetical protein KI688_002406 [Linnemannia hyalina]|uniref:Cyclin-domain-containing protein n=1 Tax=Linnemannia hyalina TaxID=64524 RepID=A0A9P7XPK6_9FUNG|nr:hypothetical protein KI688_002406 [Linnemannia hyalina]
MVVLNSTAPTFDVINHPVKDTLLIVSCLLSKLVHKNDSRYNPLRDPITLFHSRAVPRISIEAYLTRILQYIPFTNEVLLNVLVFLDRIGGLEGMQMQQDGLLTTPSTSTTTSSATCSQSNALYSTSGLAPVSSPQSSFVPVAANNNYNINDNSRGTAEDPEISCNSASSLSASSSSAPAPRLSSSSNNSTTTTRATYNSTMTTDNSDSTLPMIQKRGREAETETTTTAGNKRTKYEAAPSTPSSMPSPPLAAAVASPVPEPVQPATGNGFRINSFNIHRLLITSLMIAAKFTSDLFYSNARYAKVGGLALPELNQLELEFLFTSKFELNVKVDELQRVGNSLLQFRDRHMLPSFTLLQQVVVQQQQQLFQQPQTMTMMAMQQQLQFQAQLQSQIQAQAQAQALELKQQQQAGSLLSPPEEKRPWDETATVQNDHHSYYTHQA